MIPTIYKGDDTDFRGAARLSLRIGTEADLSGCTVEFTFLGQTRRFSGDAAAKPLSFAFSASETALFPVGVHRARVRVFDPEGRVKTVDDSVRIRVTDSVADAYGTDGEQQIPVSLVSGFTMPDIPESLDAAASDTVGVFKAKFNDLLALLRSVSALAVAVLLPFAASAANVETAPLDDIPGTAAVVTNVTLAGLATTNDVASAIASATNDPTIVRGEKFDGRPNVWNIIVFGALTAADADKARTAKNASYVPWSGVLYTPTTLGGYGITDAATKVEVEEMAKDLEKMSDHETVTNVVRKVVNAAGRYVWDKDLEVCYRLNAAGGFLDLVAVTNVDVTLPENWAALEAIENEWGAK